MRINRTPREELAGCRPIFESDVQPARPNPFHWTTKLKVAVCVVAVPPFTLVAVTVMGYVPAGVPGSVGPPPPPPPPPPLPPEPPPQPMPMNRTPRTRPIAKARQVFRREMPIKRTAANGKPRADTNTLLPESRARTTFECGAVALTIRFVDPTPSTVVGLKRQLLSLGNPEQEAAEKVMIPA